MARYTRSTGWPRKDTHMRRWYGIDIRDHLVRQTLFVCPRCGLDRDGTEVTPRRWATVFGLPVVPLGRLEQIVTCNVCSHRCDMGVLDIPTTETLAGYLNDASRNGVVAVVRAGSDGSGNIDRAVRQFAVDTLLADGCRYDDDRLDADIIGIDHTDVMTSMQRLSEEMTTYGKQAFLHRLAAVALADGNMTEAQRHMLVDIGIALSMPAMHINDVITVADLAAAA